MKRLDFIQVVIVALTIMVMGWSIFLSIPSAQANVERFPTRVYDGNLEYKVFLRKPPNRKWKDKKGHEQETEYDGMTYFNDVRIIEVDPALDFDKKRHVLLHEIYHVTVHRKGAQIDDSIELSEDDWIEASVDGMRAVFSDPRNDAARIYIFGR